MLERRFERRAELLDVGALGHAGSCKGFEPALHELELAAQHVENVSRHLVHDVHLLDGVSRLAHGRGRRFRFGFASRRCQVPQTLHDFLDHVGREACGLTAGGRQGGPEFFQAGDNLVNRLGRESDGLSARAGHGLGRGATVFVHLVRP